MVTSTYKVPAPDDHRADFLQDGGRKGSTGRAITTEQPHGRASSVFRTITAGDWVNAIRRGRVRRAGMHDRIIGQIHGRALR